MTTFLDFPFVSDWWKHIIQATSCLDKDWCIHLLYIPLGRIEYKAGNDTDLPKKKKITPSCVHHIPNTAMFMFKYGLFSSSMFTSLHPDSQQYLDNPTLLGVWQGLVYFQWYLQLSECSDYTRLYIGVRHAFVMQVV